LDTTVLLIANRPDIDKVRRGAGL